MSDNTRPRQYVDDGLRVVREWLRENVPLHHRVSTARQIAAVIEKTTAGAQSKRRVEDITTTQGEGYERNEHHHNRI
jgi:hypothetical protein